MNQFKLLEPKSLKDACDMLAKYHDRAKLISGGQSLVPLLRGRYIEPEFLINLKKLTGLSYIKEEDGFIKIGALTTHRMLETSELIKKKLPVLVEAEHRLAHLQIRNWGTVGGAISHGDPGGDLGASLISLGAKVKAVSARGGREIELEDFYVNIFTTVLEEDEILSEVIVPQLPPHTAVAYRKEAIEEGDYPISSAAALITLDSRGKIIKDARIVLGASGPTPVVAKKAAGVLIGKEPSYALAEKAGEAATKEADPTTDILGSAEYKLELVRVLVRDMVDLAITRAQKKG